MAGDARIVHVTHEAVGKIGGIGAVLQGLLTCKKYLEAVERSILISPLFSTQGPISQRLGENGEVLYSSIDGFANTKYASAFWEIENFYNANIVYGKRTFVDEQTGIKSSPEVILIDVRHMDSWPINKFKERLYDDFGIQSDLYEHIWEYEQYIRLAPAAIDVLKAIGAATDSTTIVAHEFMGMPTALEGMLTPCCNFKTAFYAHEVATMRHIVENYPGHDTMFYNIVKKAQEDELYVCDVFGNQYSYFKHALVNASKYCDVILAVGDYVAQELKFMDPKFETVNINVVYNGIPSYQISLTEKVNSKSKLQQYCQNLLGYKPDFVFTHVTRLVESKGLWRDLLVIENIEKEFRTTGKTAVMFLLSTQAAGRDTTEIYKMESEYKWPVAHREGMPDLTGGEADFYAQIQEFNAKSQNIKIVFINQFGFDRKSCGKRMPEDMEFMDIRKGSDVEFGLSIYEPFGIAQLEPLTFGGICVVSNVCGCAGFGRDVTSGQKVKNIIEADFTKLNGRFKGECNIENLLNINKDIREDIEEQLSCELAKQITRRLPENDSEYENLLQSGYNLAKNMSWEKVAENYVLSSLRKVWDRQLSKYSYSK